MLFRSPTGNVQKLLAKMPLPNDFRSGDGLNVAGYRWRLRTSPNFGQFNLKVDHTINTLHRLSFSYIRQSVNVLNGFMPQPFPDSPAGKVDELDSLYTLTLNSTFSPKTFNEFHAGALHPRVRFYAPWELPGGKELMPSINGYGYLPVFALSADPISVDNDPQGRTSPLYVYGDTFHKIGRAHV